MGDFTTVVAVWRAAIAYYSVLHQMDGVSVCLPHRGPQETVCLRCGYEVMKRHTSSVQLLEAPYRYAYCRGSCGAARESRRERLATHSWFISSGQYREP